jgi:hypothetical protein
VLRVFIEYYIEKGNTDELLKFICATIKKKRKVMKTFEDYGALILFVS